MPSAFEQRQNRIRTVLEGLDRRPLRYKDIIAIWLPAGGDLAALSHTMNWMKTKGYIKKGDSQNRFSPYEITAVGRRYLEGLKAK